MFQVILLTIGGCHVTTLVIGDTETPNQTRLDFPLDWQLILHVTKDEWMNG